jgi:hypothetical protein
MAHAPVLLEAYATLERTTPPARSFRSAPTRKKNERALEKVRQLPVRTPEEGLENISKPPDPDANPQVRRGACITVRRSS